MALREINKALINQHLKGRQLTRCLVVDGVTLEDEKELQRELAKIRRGRKKASLVLMEER
jgi:hypothetical protein